jgi:hypothetical protein
MCCVVDAKILCGRWQLLITREKRENRVSLFLQSHNDEKVDGCHVEYPK